MDGGHLKTLRDLGMSLGWGRGGPMIDFAGFDHQMEVGKWKLANGIVGGGWGIFPDGS